MPIGNKQSFGPAVVLNQVRLTATTKHTADGVGGAVTSTGVGFIRGNGLGFGGENGVGFYGNNGVGSSGEVGVGSVCISSSGNNGVGSNMEFGTDGNLGDVVVCLGVLSAMTTSPASSQFNIAASTFLTVCCGYPTPVFSVVQVGQAIKPPVMFSQA